MDWGEANDTLTACYHRPISAAARVGKTMEARCRERGGGIAKTT